MDSLKDKTPRLLQRAGCRCASTRTSPGAVARAACAALPMQPLLQLCAAVLPQMQRAHAPLALRLGAQDRG